jgi:group I intron endonuclease
MAHKNKTSGIYSITSPSNKMYIGQSINVERRLQTHKSMLRRGNHTNTRLQGACNKYGLDNLVFKLVECCEKDTLDTREQWWIDNHNTPYNMSRVAKNNMADPAVAKKASKTKKANAHITSEQLRLRWQDPDYKKAIADKRKTLWTDPAYRANISEKRKLMWASPEHREKIAKAMKQSPAVKASVEKLVAAHRTRSATEEYKQKMRDTAAERRKLAGPGKREMDYNSRNRLGSPALSEKLSQGLTTRHENNRYQRLLEAGILLYSSAGLQNTVNAGRKSAATSEQQHLSMVARSVLRNIKDNNGTE